MMENTSADNKAPEGPKFFFIKNLKATSAEALGGWPWEFPEPVRPLEKGANKAAYRKWCESETTDWCFISPFEGLTPSLRVNKDSNPAFKMHGFIADYDGDLDEAAALAAVKKNSQPGMGPAAMCRSFSGKYRVAWVFSSPVFCSDREAYKNFIGLFAERAWAKTLLPGYDSSSERPTQYFEFGGGWKSLGGARVSSAAIYGIQSLAASKVKVAGARGGDVPIEVVAAEVEKRFPGIWKGPFEVGAMGCLFWLPDPQPDKTKACRVFPWGMWAFSTRAGTEKWLWEDIFGKAFVERFEEERFGQCAEEFWFDGTKYWARENGELWVRVPTEEMSRRLKVSYSLSAQIGRKETSSQVDRALVAIQKTKRVQNVAPFIYNPQEIVAFNGLRYLNINGRAMLPAAPEEAGGDFPWLREFFDNIWDGETDENGVGQRDYFFAWLKRFWASGLKGRLHSGQVVFIAGEAGQGKTLLSSYIVGQTIAGGVSNASGYLLGGDTFNKELAEVGVWSVDDGNATIDGSARRTFSARIKQAIANPTISYHPKFMDASVMPWQGRIIVTCNTDPESLSIIPATDNSVTDKLMLFQFGDWVPDFPPNHELEALIKAEMPYFLRWLAAWEPPASIAGKHAGNRYGVKSFLHPAMLQHSRELSGHTHFREDLDAIRKQPGFTEKHADGEYWEGTASDLLRGNRDSFADRGITPIVTGMRLAQIEKEGLAPWLVRHELGSRRTLWRVYKDLPPCDPVAQ